MLRSEHANEELVKMDEIIENSKDKTAGAILKCLTLILKVMFSIRTNQTLIMNKMGVEKIQPNIKRDRDITEKEIK